MNYKLMIMLMAMIIVYIYADNTEHNDDNNNYPLL